MARDNHCNTDDDPSTDGMCHLRLRTHAGRTEADEAFREELEIFAGLSGGRRSCALRAIYMRTSVWLSQGTRKA